MIREVQSAISRHGLLTRGDRVVVAVSGGADSVCLLVVLDRLRERLGIRLSVAHLDHRLRGKASEDDAEFVAKLAERLDLPVAMGRSDVKRLADTRGISIEMAAREARYTFLARTARRCGADVVATAHTASDQAETVLLKLVRGTGMRGLAGIPRKSFIKGVAVVRPLLDMPGLTLRHYLRRNRVTWREDASNSELHFLRNRVRHELLPQIAARFNPGIEQSLCRTAEICADEDAWLDVLTDGLLDTCVLGKGRGLDASRLRVQPVAAQRRLIRSWLVEEGAMTDSLDFNVVDRVLRLALAVRGSGQVPLKEGGVVTREYCLLRLVHPQQAESLNSFRVRVRCPGETILPEIGLRVRVRVAPGIRRDGCRGAGELPAFASLSRRRIGRKALYVRTWSPGDRMHPMGMEGSRKLQDIFVDAKLPMRLRKRVPVLECGGQIIWLPGYRVARGWGLADPFEDALQIDVTA